MASGTEPKICGGGRRYCVLCSHFEGEVLPDGAPIKLHCIPKEPSKVQDKRSRLKMEQRRGWISQIKLARPNAPITSSTRLCNLHFKDHM